MTEHALGLRGEAGSTVALGLALTPVVRNRSRLCPLDDTSRPLTVAIGHAGDVFDVVDTATSQIVYSGAIVNKKLDDNTGETECYGDFTNVTTPGTYVIHSQIGVNQNVELTLTDLADHPQHIRQLQVADELLAMLAKHFRQLVIPVANSKRV